MSSFLTADRRSTYCLYEAPSPDALVAAAQWAGLPADVVVEVDPHLRLIAPRDQQSPPGLSRRLRAWPG